MVAPTAKPNNSSVKPKVSLGDFGLNEIWDVIQRRKRLIILSVVMMWMLGLAYCYYAQQTYESSSQVLVMRKDPALATTGAPSKTGSEPAITEDLLSTHMQVLTSQLIIDDALKQTIKRSELEKIKKEYRATEELTSTNLRYAVTRLFQAKKTITPPAVPSTPSTDAAATTSPVSTTESTTAATLPTANAPVAAAPAGSAAEAPKAEGAVDAPPADVTSVTAGEARKLLTKNPSELPSGPLPDGDMVLTLADLPKIVEELKSTQLPQQYVTENLIIARGGGGQTRTSHMLTIAFRHPDPVEARLVLDAVLQSYQHYLNERFRDVSKEAAHLIEDASNTLKKELEAQQHNYQTFREQSPILGSGSDATSGIPNIHKARYEETQKLLTLVEQELINARTRLIEVELELVRLSKPGVDKLVKVSLIDEKSMVRLGTILTAAMAGANVQDPKLMALIPEVSAQKQNQELLNITKLTETRAQLNALRNLFGEKHDEVQRVKSALESLENSLASEKTKTPIINMDSLKSPQVFDPDLVMNVYLQLLRSDVSVLNRKKQDLLELAGQEEELAKGLLPYELEEENLKQQVSRAQELYDTVIDRLREINLAKDYSGFINDVMVQPAFGAEVWPSVPIVMVVASMFGLLIGVAGAALTEYGDRSFREPDDIRRDLGLTLLTHIPNLHGKTIDKRQLVEGSKMHATVYAYHRPKSREAEVFRGLRTSLFFSTQGQKCQVLGFTSPNQGDGKSTVTSNLAVSIAQTGRKVLLVDCDLRRPNVHKLLGISNDVGLSDVIGGEMEPWDAIQQTETTNLWSLPSGPLPANPAELLTSSTFEQFIKMAREKYDYILLDCPPVLAVADPCIVAPRTDGMTLVLRVSKDSRPQAMRAKEMLDRVHARMLGVVVNASQEAHKTGYGKYGESSHAYSYDYGYGGYGYSSYNKYYEEDTTTARSKKTGR